MNRPRVSIVVPMYNVEHYLEKCVDRILTQMLKGIEIILVDDGSPDRSGKIAEDYARKDSRVRVIHQKNAGLGPARNTGITNASGEYIGFVDSDDWVDSAMFKRLYDTAVRCDADIVVGGHRDMVNGAVRASKVHPLAGQIFKGHNQIMPVRNRLFGHLPEDTEVEAFPMRVWTAIYRNDFLQKNGLRFEAILSEDTIFNLSAYRCADVIAFTGDTDYCYRMDEHPSIMRSFSSEKLVQYERFVERVRLLAEKETYQHDECVIRARRTAIDYCRLYVGLIVGSGLSLRSKLKNIRSLAQSRMCIEACAGYPLETLPKQQRMLHEALSLGHVREVFILADARRILKEKGWWK